MSLLFLYIGNWAKNTSSSSKCFYKCILASNRDERLSVKIAPAKFWQKPDDHILADYHANDKFGTWLGVTKAGHLSNVLKIKRDILNLSTDEYVRRRQKRQANFHISRAALVPNFLNSKLNNSIPGLANIAESNVELSSLEFANKICEGSEHNCNILRFYPFHFVGVDLAPKSASDSITATYLSNKAIMDVNQKPIPVNLTPPPGTCEFLAYGNSPIYKPFQKVVHGRMEFMDLISNYMCSEAGLVIATPANKEAIKEQLLNFLRSKKKYLPDPVLLEYARGDRMKERIANRQAARFVTNFYDMETRVQTIIFVDTENNVTFCEYIIEIPNQQDLNLSTFIESVHEFKINK